MKFILPTPVLIRHLWQLKTDVFLHWCLICAVPLHKTYQALLDLQCLPNFPFKDPTYRNSECFGRWLFLIFWYCILGTLRTTILLVKWVGCQCCLCQLTDLIVLMLCWSSTVSSLGYKYLTPHGKYSMWTSMENLLLRSNILYHSR
jgi:hypothetical protein